MTRTWTSIRRRSLIFILSFSSINARNLVAAALRGTMSVVRYGDLLEPDYEQPYHRGAGSPRPGQRGDH